MCFCKELSRPIHVPLELCVMVCYAPWALPYLAVIACVCCVRVLLPARGFLVCFCCPAGMPCGPATRGVVSAPGSVLFCQYRRSRHVSLPNTVVKGCL